MGEEMEERDLVMFLDDDPKRAALAYQRMPEDELPATVWCKTVAETVEVLMNYSDRLKKVYLDHDLEGQIYMNSRSPYSGMEIVRYLEKQDSHKFTGCHFVIHSHNEYAATRMVDRLKKAGYSVEAIPFGM
jgi:hypothetical protein